MSKLGIITISHGRPEILRLWCASIKRLRQDCDWFPVIVVGDAGEHSQICYEYEITHWPMRNNPASKKWNAGMEWMMEQKVDYVLISGSDDIISSSLLKNILLLTEQDYDMIGIKKIWFYCAEGLYRGRSRGIEQKNYLGVCKTISRSVIEKAGTLWTRDRSWGMDADCQRNISPYVRTTATAEGLVFDIKTSESLNKYTMVQNKATLEASWPFEADQSLLWSIMGEEEREILKKIEK